MKHPGALKIIILGPLALGLVLAVGILLVSRELRTIEDALSALALIFGSRVRSWAVACGDAVQWYASSLMMLALGYLLASAIHRTSDMLTGLAVLLLFLGAQAKVIFGIVFRSGYNPPNGGGGPRPPLAPILRPPGGRPPVLHAAAEVQHEPAV
jgi:hypothetical protein